MICNTIEHGLVEINVDKLVTALSVPDDEQSLILGLLLSQMRHCHFLCYLYILLENLMCLHLQE